MTAPLGGAGKREVLTAAAAVLGAVAHSDHPHLVHTVIVTKFPWGFPMGFYLSSEEEADEFIDELVGSLQAPSSLDNPAPVVHPIAMCGIP
ncbi:hypothetical protein [Rhodococcus pyridinivorans]|uniref:hypothetical protein n=1 Tax=Rhodococcus pyridinivorans TaxID=103816 RepID=UPI000A606254|nr:hypothetical protein [Rhodococcus pyridinivorans]